MKAFLSSTSEDQYSKLQFSEELLLMETKLKCLNTQQEIQR